MKTKPRKPFAISKHLVFNAWQRVPANKSAPGVDAQNIEKHEARFSDKLYKL